MVEYWELKKPLPNEENHKVVNEYLLTLKIRHWNKKSIETYLFSLQSFFKDIEEPFFALKMQDIERWMKKKEEHRSQKSIRYVLCTLRSFFRYCVEKGLIEKQPIPDKREKGKGRNYWKLQIELTNKQNHKVINEYLMSLKIANYSKESIATYRYFLQKFFKEREELFSFLTSNEIQQWFIQHEKGFKEVTLSGHLTILSSFYNFCVEEGYVDKSPIKSRMFPRIIKPIPKYLDKEEIAKVRQIAENAWIRNRTIFEFLISSGCRISELYQLDRSKVDLENRIAMVFGKGKKYRQVHFSVKCAILLGLYLERRTDENAALFVSSRGKENRLSKGRIRDILKQFGQEAGIKGTLHPHRLRHTFATDMLSKGADLLFIADELGHTNITTTQIYANLPKQEMISLYRKYMG